MHNIGGLSLCHCDSLEQSTTVESPGLAQRSMAMPLAPQRRTIASHGSRQIGYAHARHATRDSGQQTTDDAQRATDNMAQGGARLGSRQIVYAHAGDTPTSPEEPTAPIALIGSRTKHSSGWSQTRICHSGPEYCVAVLGALYAMSAHSAVWLLYATLHVASRLLPTALCEYSQRRTATGHRPQRTVWVAHGTDH